MTKKKKGSKKKSSPARRSSTAKKTKTSKAKSKTKKTTRRTTTAAKQKRSTKARPSRKRASGRTTKRSSAKTKTPLGQLFGSEVRVKVLRQFLFHPQTAYDLDMLTKNAGAPKTALRKELTLLKRIGFLKPKTFAKEKTLKSGKVSKKKAQGFVLDTTFPYVSQLEQLLTGTNLVSDDNVLRRLRSAGNFQLVALSGVFTGEKAASLDMLLVAPRVNKRSLTQALARLEEAIGTELAYAVLDPEEFVYRASVRDRLIRDLFEFTHRIPLNKLSDETLPRL